MLFNITPTMTLLTVAGSHSYGMNTPESDVDIRGICVAPFDVRLSSHNFEQYEGEWPQDIANLPSFNHNRFKEICYSDNAWKHPEDLVIFDISKVIKLLGECNPNVIELLFCDNKDYLFLSEVGEKLISERKRFLTLKAKHAYTGYARAQLKKIERHRSYLLGKIPQKPTRSEFGLPEHESLIPQAERNLINEEIQQKIKEWSADNIELQSSERIALKEHLRSFMCTALSVKNDELENKLEEVAAASLGFDQNVKEILRRERGFRNALKGYKSYMRWKEDRNPKRKLLEEKHGFDTKHASHLIRLSRSGIEVLRDGDLKVRREDAEELLAIRRGEFSYDHIKNEADLLFEEMTKLEIKNPCNLPKKSDYVYLDKLVREIIMMSLR